MNDPIEHAVRVAVRELAERAQPAHLAAAAIAEGRRLHRRTRARQAAGAVLTGVALVAAIAVPSLLLHPGRTTKLGPVGGPTTTPAHSLLSPGPERLTFDGPIALPGGWTVLAAGNGPVHVWNRDRRAYQAIDRDRVLVAPAGPYAAAPTDDPHQIEILDLRGRAPRTFVLAGGITLEPQWSPDGTRLLLTTLDKDTGTSFITIVDAGSGDVTSWPIDDRYVCTDWCLLTWTRDGSEVVWSLTDLSVPRSELGPHARSGLQLFSATDGHPTRTLPVRGNISGPYAWSPNGRYVIATGVSTQLQPRTTESQLVNVATGAVLRTFPDGTPYWVTNDRILVADAGRGITLVDPTGAVVAQYDGPDILPLLGPA
jgi:hypothetical protein